MTPPGNATKPVRHPGERRSHDSAQTLDTRRTHHDDPRPGTGRDRDRRTGTGTGRTARPRRPVTYLTGQYHLTVGEALRRIDLQRRAPALADALASRVPDQYGGMLLDQDAGGILRVGLTRPDALPGLLSGFGDAAHVTAYRGGKARVG
jgi:hypothetical protein